MPVPADDIGHGGCKGAPGIRSPSHRTMAAGDPLTEYIETFVNAATSYQRNQVTWAVARCIIPYPAPDFERDIAVKLQRLIDKDRALALDAPLGAHAFLDDDLPGKGTLVRFTEESAFLLLLGLLFLESGLTQSRVVRLIRDMKDDLCLHYHWVLSFPAATLKGSRSAAVWQKDLGRGRVARDPAHLTFVVATGNLADPEAEVEHRLCRNRDQLLQALARAHGLAGDGYEVRPEVRSCRRDAPARTGGTCRQGQ